jgi:putative transposase
MNDTQLTAFVTSFLPSQFILATARQLGVLHRQSKFDLILFVWILVFCSFSATTASLAHFQRHYLRLAPIILSRSAFYKRFTPSMALLFERLFEHLIRLGLETPNHWLHHYLDSFDGVFAIDSTTVALRKTLESVWQACNAGSSALKIHAVYNVLDFKLHHVRFTSAREHDIVGVEKIADFCRNKLILFDLGYYSHEVFAQIIKHKGFFVCRLKDNVQPKILHELVPGRGRPAKLAGMPLRMALDQLTRQRLDLWVQLGCGKEKVECRLVGGRDKEGKWRLYLTNLDAEKVESGEVIQLYRVRWQVELLFKQLKSRGHLDSLAGKSEATIKIQMYAILMGYAICGELMGQVRRKVGERHVSMTRALEGLRVMGCELLEMVYEGVEVRRQRPSWMERFAQMSVDPNHNRRRFIDPLLRTSTLANSPPHQRIA